MVFDTLKVSTVDGWAMIYVTGRYAFTRLYDHRGRVEGYNVKRLPKAVYDNGAWNIFALVTWFES